MAIPFLPIAMFPEITPPQVVVTATYPGASAEVVEQTVTTPIEQQVNGVENMIYMSSRSGSDGTMTLTVTFKVGTDLDIAAVNVQNRVAIAQAKLPAGRVRQGVSVTKQSPDLVEIVALVSPDGSRDELYLSNYATLQIVDVLARVPGVGQVTVFNGRDYGMRLWLNPDRLASLGLTAGDVADAVREQNSGRRRPDRPAPGAARPAVPVHGDHARPPVDAGASSRTSCSARGPTARCSACATSARVELGAQNYGSFGRVGGQAGRARRHLPAAGRQRARRVARRAGRRWPGWRPSFPSGVTHTRPYNTTEFVRVSIEEVVHTLLIAIGLVVLTVYVFLQDWRATLIPTLTIPVSLVGTFAVISAFGFSINTLTLFGLVLAIGIVVDDAIVVVENTQRHLDEQGLRPREATRPRHGGGGGTGHRHRARAHGGVRADRVPARHHRPALPAVRAHDRGVGGALSALNALTLTPALCALLLRPAREGRQRWLARALERGVRAR